MRPLIVVLAALLLANCARNEPVAEKSLKSTAEEPVKTYALKGEVTRLDAENKIATIKHEQIGDWMGAMTMDFPVKNAADFSKLSEGKTVEATVYVQGLNYWVEDVKETSQSPTK